MRRQVAVLDPRRKIVDPLKHAFSEVNVIQLGCSNTGYAALLEDRRTILASSDFNSQTNDNSDKITVCTIKLPSAEKSPISFMNVGRSFLLCLTVSGRVYGYGSVAFALTSRPKQFEREKWSNELLAIETEVERDPTTYLAPIHEMFNIKSYFVFGGYSNCFLCTTNHMAGIAMNEEEEEHNVVYAYGNNNDGALGKGDMQYSGKAQEFSESLSFRTIKGRITKMGSGYGQTIALSALGQVYGCGYSHFGELGVGKKGSFGQMQHLTFFQDHVVSDVACGTFHTVFLTSSPRVALFITGRTDEGQIGIGDSNDCVLSPVEVQIPNQIPIKVAAKGRWSLVVTSTSLTSSSQALYACGEVYNFKNGSQRFFAPLYDLPQGYTVQDADGGEDHVTVLLVPTSARFQKKLFATTALRDIVLVFS